MTTTVDRSGNASRPIASVITISYRLKCAPGDYFVTVFMDEGGCVSAAMRFFENATPHVLNNITSISFTDEADSTI